MQIKLKDILENVQSIKNLQMLNLPVKVSYRIKRLNDRLKPILASYEEKRTDLIKEFGEVDEQGNFEVKDPEKLKEFIVKITELQSIEEEVEFEAINISELGNITVSANDLVSFIFTE